MRLEEWILFLSLAVGVIVTFPWRITLAVSVDLMRLLAEAEFFVYGIRVFRCEAEPGAKDIMVRYRKKIKRIPYSGGGGHAVKLTKSIRPVCAAFGVEIGRESDYLPSIRILGIAQTISSILRSPLNERFRTFFIVGAKRTRYCGEVTVVTSLARVVFALLSK